MNPLFSGFTLFVSAVAGDVYVADGGRLVVAGTSIQLAGIDAPAPNSEDGRMARQIVRDFTTGKTVICHVSPNTHAGGARDGVCFAGGEDIGAALIAGGYALDCPRTSAGRYSALEPAGSRNRLTQRGDCRVALR